jgi:hypothetical protein
MPVVGFISGEFGQNVMRQMTTAPSSVKRRNGVSAWFYAPAAEEEEDQMEDRTQLKIAFKSMRKASKALRRSVKTSESEVERLRLADDFRKKAQGWADLIAKGDTARKSPRARQ